MESTLIGLISILTVGVSAQWVAWRFKIPSIVLLLISGFLAGPILGFINPDQILGDLLFPIVSISVAIILFEGGLSLKISELTTIAKVVRNFITVGIAVTLILATWGAWFILHLDFEMALLFGSILVVTGPTVIIPLLRHLRLSGKTASILKWEGMLNDPIGAVMAILVFEAIVGGGFAQSSGHIFFGLFKTLFFGITVGVISAKLVALMLKKYWVPDFLQSAFALTMVTMTFCFSNHFQTESGLLAVTIMGMLLTNDKDVEIGHIIEFKENLRVLLIASVFIILAARLELTYFTHIGLPSLLFLVFLIVIVRPVAVFLSTIGSGLPFKEKIFLASMAPRGIVAAAVSSVFALHLEQLGYPNADRLVALTFFMIVGTIVFYGVTSPFIAKWTKVAQANPQGVLILSAHYWARKMGLALAEQGIKVLLIDSNAFNVSRARAAGLAAVNGNVFSEEFISQLDLSGIGRFLAMTSNDEVNSLAALHYAEIFGRQEVYQLCTSADAAATQENVSKKLRGRFLFSKGMAYGDLNDNFRKKGNIQKVQFTKEYTYDLFKADHEGRYVPLFLLSEAKKIKVMTVTNPPIPQENQALLALVLQEEPAS